MDNFKNNLGLQTHEILKLKLREVLKLLGVSEDPIIIRLQT